MKHLIYLFLVLALISCKKDEDPVPDNVKPAFVMTGSYKYELRWSVGTHTSGWDYARLYVVQDNDTSVNTSTGYRHPMSSNGGYANYVNSTVSGGPSGVNYIGISYYTETSAGTALTTDSPEWYLIYIDPTDATRKDTVARGQFTRADKDPAKVYFVATMNIDHTANTYTVKAINQPFWLGNYSF